MDYIPPGESSGDPVNMGELEGGTAVDTPSEPSSSSATRSVWALTVRFSRRGNERTRSNVSEIGGTMKRMWRDLIVGENPRTLNVVKSSAE